MYCRQSNYNSKATFILVNFNAAQSKPISSIQNSTNKKRESLFLIGKAPVAADGYRLRYAKADEHKSSL